MEQNPSCWMFWAPVLNRPPANPILRKHNAKWIFSRENKLYDDVNFHYLGPYKTGDVVYRYGHIGMRFLLMGEPSTVLSGGKMRLISPLWLCMSVVEFLVTE